MKRLATFCALSLTLNLALAQSGEAKKEEGKKEAAPAAAAKEVAVIKTSDGNMVIEFWPDVAPKTVENFKALAKKGFYDGTAFHRVIKGFMIQGGDPNTKDPANEKAAPGSGKAFGEGGPDYRIKAEFNDRHHGRGVISMARSGDPMERLGQPPRPQFADSAGSQFFICHGDAASLDHKYTAFGKLIKGDDVLDKIANTPVTTSAGGEPSKPTTRVEVKKIEIAPADSIK